MPPNVITVSVHGKFLSLSELASCNWKIKSHNKILRDGGSEMEGLRY